MVAVSKGLMAKAAASALVSCLFLGVTLTAPAPGSAAEPDESLERYFRIFDGRGNEVFQTGIEVSIGDRFITADNKKYVVTGVEEDRAEARFVSTVDLLAGSSVPPPQSPGTNALSLALKNLVSRVVSTFGVAQGEEKLVAIYHTHSDESYVPSDGTASIRGNGGIYQVGASFAEALNDSGARALHDKTRHDPHDAAAYDRSRRTAEELLKKQPAALFDIHRDTTPADTYRTEVNGEQATKVLIVVGRQNPQMEANLDFAKKLKAAVDERHPGLIRGIYFARGKYNQDLSPRALLLEVGSHQNRRENAENGIAMMADAVPAVIAAAEAQPGRPAPDRGSWAAVGWIVLLVVLGAAAFLVISTGSLEEATNRLRRFFAEELPWPARRRRLRQEAVSEEGEPEAEEPRRE